MTAEDEYRILSFHIVIGSDSEKAAIAAGQRPVPGSVPDLAFADLPTS